LPEIVVTTPSPVAKPASKAKAAPKAAPAESDAPVPKAAAKIAEDAFASVTVMPAEEVVSAPSATLAGALMSQPGIIASTFAPGASRPVIRGFDNFRVLMQENGIGSHDVSALSEDHAVPIDPLVVDRIEVVRGPGTLRYGSQAIGGVVNAFTGRIPEIIPPKGVSFVMRGGLSSVDGGADGAFKVAAGSGNTAVYACLQAPRRRLRHPAGQAIQLVRRQRGLRARHLVDRQGRLHRHRLLALHEPLRHSRRRGPGGAA
jgi:iron complex outermembrane receptor protein